MRETSYELYWRNRNRMSETNYLAWRGWRRLVSMGALIMAWRAR